MENCSTKRWKFLLYFHHYFYTHGKCPSFRKDFSQENYDHLSKTVLVNSIGFITIVLKMQRFVSFVSKPCLLVPFHLTMLNKQLLKQDLETGKRRQTRKKTFFSMKHPHRTVNLQNDTLNQRPLTIQQAKLYHHEQNQTNKQQKKCIDENICKRALSW